MKMFSFYFISILLLFLLLNPSGCQKKPYITKILDYIDKGNTEKIQLAISKNQNLLYSYTSDGLSLLHYAVKSGQKEITELLLQSGIPVDIQDKEGYTPLFSSLDEKNTDITELLLKKGASLTFKYKGLVTPLLYASGNGNVDGAALLIEYGADVNEGLHYDTVITHPLGVAVENNNVTLATLFLDKGAEVNAYLSDKVSPLYRAVETGNIDLISLLVSRGADVNASNRGYDTTALILAAELGYSEIITYLIKNGAQISQADKYGKTPIYVASGDGSIEIVKLLYSLGASKHDISMSLCSAAGKNQYEVFMYLISIGADIHVKTLDSATALFYVAENNAIKICQYLIDHGAKINYQANFEKMTPLMQAVYHDRLVITKMLLENGARVTIKDRQGHTALDYVKSPVIKRLLGKYLP